MEWFGFAIGLAELVVPSGKIDYRLCPHAPDDLTGFAQAQYAFPCREEIGPVSGMLPLDDACSQTKFQPSVRDDVKSGSPFRQERWSLVCIAGNHQSEA